MKGDVLATRWAVMDRKGIVSEIETQRTKRYAMDAARKWYNPSGRPVLWASLKALRVRVVKVNVVEA